MTTTAHASVLAYSTSTPVVEAIATRETASPTCARSTFDTRGSRETVYASSSSAIFTLSSAETMTLCSRKISGIDSDACGSGSALCSSGSERAAFSRARHTVPRASSSEGSAAHA